MDYYSSQQMDYFLHHCTNGHIAQSLRHLSTHPSDLRKGLLTMAEHGRVECLHAILKHHTIAHPVQKDIFCVGLRTFQYGVIECALNNFDISENMLVNSFLWLIGSSERSNNPIISSISRLLLERIDLQHYPTLFKQVARFGHETTLIFMLNSDAPKTILPNISDQIDVWPIVFWGCQHFSNQAYPSLLTGARDEQTRLKYDRLWLVCEKYITPQDMEQRLLYESKFRDQANTLFKRAYVWIDEAKRNALLKTAQEVHTGFQSARKKI